MHIENIPLNRCAKFAIDGSIDDVTVSVPGCARLSAWHHFAHRGQKKMTHKKWLSLEETYVFPYPVGNRRASGQQQNSYFPQFCSCIPMNAFIFLVAPLFGTLSTCFQSGVDCSKDLLSDCSLSAASSPARHLQSIHFPGNLGEVCGK